MKKILFCIITLLVMIPNVYASTAISSISIEGIGNLNPNRTSWNATLTSSLDYANIEVTPSDETATVTGAGKVSLNEGDNSIAISVTDSAGNKKDYTLNLKLVKKTNSSTGNPNTGAFISVTSLLAAGLIGIYFYNKSKSKSKFYKI